MKANLTRFPKMTTATWFFLLSVICGLAGTGLLLYRSLRIVPVRQVWVICSRATGQFRRLITRPGLALIWPTETIHRFDLIPRSLRLDVAELPTADLAVAVSLDVTYAFAADYLAAADLDAVQPLLPKAGVITRAWAAHILHALAAGHSTASLLSVGCRARVENQLQCTLQSRVQRLGLRVLAVRLLVSPTPMLLQSRLLAQRDRLLFAACALDAEQPAAAMPPASLMRRLALHTLRQEMPADLSWLPDRDVIVVHQPHSSRSAPAQVVTYAP